MVLCNERFLRMTSWGPLRAQGLSLPQVPFQGMPPWQNVWSTKCKRILKSGTEPKLFMSKGHPERRIREATLVSETWRANMASRTALWLMPNASLERTHRRLSLDRLTQPRFGRARYSKGFNLFFAAWHLGPTNPRLSKTKSTWSTFNLT